MTEEEKLGHILFALLDAETAMVEAVAQAKAEGRERAPAYVEQAVAVWTEAQVRVNMVVSLWRQMRGEGVQVRYREYRGAIEVLYCVFKVDRVELHRVQGEVLGQGRKESLDAYR